MPAFILITGASRGIGAATALAAARVGYRVGVNYVRDAAAASAVCARIADEGGEAIALPGDVAKESEVLAMFERIDAEDAPLTALVNNAGIVGLISPFTEYTEARLRRTFDVNILGSFLCAREAVKRMATTAGGAGGAIVNVSSAAARIGSANEFIDYAASKGAIDSMTLGLAREFATAGIRVNAVRPGIIDTEIHASAGAPDRVQRFAAAVPMQRAGTADEVARAIMWLLSDAASYTTGSFVDVSGGAERDEVARVRRSPMTAAERLFSSVAHDAPDLPSTPLAYCWRYARAYGAVLAVMLVLEAGQSACSILLPFAIKEIMNAVTRAQAGGIDVWQLVKQPFWLFAALNVGVVLFSRSSGALLVMLGPELRRRVRRELFAYLQHHSQRYFLGNFAGSIANRIAETAMSVAFVLWTVLFDFWPLTIAFGVSLVLLAGVSIELVLVLGVWTAIYVGVSFWLALQCRRYSRDYAAARSTVSGKIVDSVSNVLNAKLFARRDHEREHLEGYLDLEVERARATFWFMERIRWFQFLAAMVLMLGIIGYALSIWSARGMTVGDFAMSASLALLLIEQARGLSRRFLDFFEYVGNINDGVGMIVRPHEVVDRAGAAELVVTRGEIRFAGVDFGYTPERPLFQGLDLVLCAGERVGLVGYSGSGKTTLVNLILRLFDTQAGQILIDGQDIRDVTQESLRRAIAMIPQEPMLFHRSLRDNIRYGRLDATDEDVIAAARRAHAHEFIEQAEDGYAALVGERGVKLSGGQRQRIALARAILKEAPILLLDEATSALDSVTERGIQSSLEYLMRDRTVIVIAHRLSTLAHLDRILVFHAGRIVEDGDHDSLLAQGGHYAHLWQMQAGGFLPHEEIPA